MIAIKSRRNLDLLFWAYSKLTFLNNEMATNAVKTDLAIILLEYLDCLIYQGLIFATADLTRRSDTDDWIEAMPGIFVRVPVRKFSYSRKLGARIRSR